MRKKIGFKFASLSVSTPDGRELAPKLRELIRGYLDGMGSYDWAEKLSVALFMLYCSYVSRNADDLGLDDFDLAYSIDEVRGNLGNEYLATDFAGYYAGLCSQNDVLPDLRGYAIPARDLSKSIGAWTAALEASGLSLLEDADGSTAPAIQRVVAEELLSSDRWGRLDGVAFSPQSIAELVTRLVGVEGKTVLDFACGGGSFLAVSLAKGARSACGRDVDPRAVSWAKTNCFFADPSTSHDIAVADALAAESVAAPAQRVFVAPPFGVRLADSLIPDKGYYADTLAAVMGEGANLPINTEDFFVAKALASLSDDGVAVLHVSPSFLFHRQKGRQALRSALVEGGYLRTVVELPSGCVPGTGLRSALLVIAKEPAGDGVFIVDFDSRELEGKGYVTKGRGGCEITEAGIDWLVTTVGKRDEIPFVSTVVPRGEILATGGNLCYSAYGDVFDYGSIHAETRSSDEILGDIQAAQAAIGVLDTRIADILSTIEKKG